MQEQTNDTRRQFLRAGTAALGSFLILKPKTVRAYEANSAVRIGLLGCGGRGTAVANSFAKNTSARIVALADIFPDQLEKAKAHFDEVASSLGYSGPDPKLMFRGHEAYQQLAASKEIDSIHISTPPFFHVEHLGAAIKAGKHAYCEKPVGIDTPQTNRALELAAQVNGKVSVDVGFQIRSAPPFRELVDRIHNGAIGKLVSISAHYYAPANMYPDRPAGMSQNELRLRNWQWLVALSGDIVVEQDIHVVDICNWILNSHPVAVTATASRAVIDHWGDDFDNYQCLYTYPDDIHVALTTKQYGLDKYFDVSEQVFGSKGYSESPYSGNLRIVGENAWQWQGSQSSQPGAAEFSATGQFSDNLAEADSEKDKGFIDSIVSGQFHNQIATGVETARSAIMARLSARERRPVTWDECLRSQQHLDPALDLKQFS